MSSSATAAGVIPAPDSGHVNPATPADAIPPKRKSFFLAALFAPKEAKMTTKGTCSYISLGGSKNVFDARNLVIRPCYDHLLPVIHNRTLPNAGEAENLAITGTPGIGKSVFGVVLVRHYLERKRTVLYWYMDDIYMFSFDAGAKSHFGLFDFATMADGSMCYAGHWESTPTASVRIVPLLEDTGVSFDRVIIHDPSHADERVAKRHDSLSYPVVYVLSHGHSLIPWWIKKNKSPEFYYMPLWTRDEAETSLPLLRSLGNDPRQLDDVDGLHHKFGGCIRGWLAKDQRKFLSEMEAKVTAAVEERGKHMLRQSTEARGSIIHMFVDFDENRPRIPFKEAEEGDPVSTSDRGENDVEMTEGQDADGSEDVDGEPNDFTQFQYIFGSTMILKDITEKLTETENDALEECIKRWSDPDSGFECVYGAIFELLCHNRLLSRDGAGSWNRKLRMRIVHSGASNQPDEQTQTATFPEFSAPTRYPSNSPSILTDGKTDYAVGVNVYLWPRSSTHPTYDAAVVVKGVDVGLPEVKLVGLLLQMTVSGATGLIRCPKHSVQRDVRIEFEKVFKNRIDDWDSSCCKAYTAFMVPSACFYPFKFQKESRNRHMLRDQPECQLVFEMPEIFKYRPKPGSPTAKKNEEALRFTKRPRHEYDRDRVQLDDEA